MSAATSVWVVLSYDDSTTAEGDGTAFMGVFSSRERALAALRDQLLGERVASSIEWTDESGRGDMYVGIDWLGNRYDCYLAGIDEEYVVPQ